MPEQGTTTLILLSVSNYSTVHRGNHPKSNIHPKSQLALSISTIMPSLSHLFKHSTSLRRTALIAGSVASWIPAWLFFQDNVFQIMTVTGASMYPFLNKDFHTSTSKTSVLVDMRKPWEKLQRGTVIAFW